MSTDGLSRSQALDVSRSFIVQAPAGSGKTELLIQRYLRLLSRVDLPEQVLAMTFTRKAAAELRQRVITAFEDFRTNDGAVPAHAHLQTTRNLVADVLRRSDELGWALDEQPQRLRIETVDSLNAWLSNHLSVLAGGIGTVDLVEDPLPCYALAIRRTMASLGDGGILDRAITLLLRAADGNAGRLEQMLVDLQRTRDQWLPYLGADDDRALRQRLQLALRRLVGEALESLNGCVSASFSDELTEILRSLADNSSNLSVAEKLAVWRDSSGVLDAKLDALDAWRIVPDLLLTRSKSTWRKRWTSKDGISAAHATVRDQLAKLVARHQHDESLRLALQTIRDLPEPEYATADWELINALRVTLKHLVAQLKVVFGQRHAADFIEIALAAQLALGRVDEPSDLMLALDRRIQHILVDEFQDTSHSQFRLLELLTSGWQPEDGRTLFLVGDPMQSIYRFRHADMSLFLKTQVRGIGSLSLTPLRLEKNFRSAPAILDWVNSTFARVFPTADDIGAGAARFYPCLATRASVSEQGVEWHAMNGSSTTAEADRVCEILRDEIRLRPDGSIAVLVRSRSHLAGLELRLRSLEVPVRAVELEAPKQKQAVQDLLGLTRALLHLDDRLAWLGLLRAPWCGLVWADLLLVGTKSKQRSIWASINDDALQNELSADGRERTRLVCSVLRDALAQRGRWPFHRWVERTWVAIGGPDCLERDDQSEIVEQYFAKLAELTVRGDLDDPILLESKFDIPYRQGDVSQRAGVEIMTIHRAKGLEFDTVVLLGLGRRPRVDAQRALYWLERTASDGHEDLLLAPIAPVAEGGNRLIEFIRHADAARDQAESTRLLYVAATRARERLHLVAQLRDSATAPLSNSFLAHLWDDAATHFDAAPRLPEAEPGPDAIVPELRRVRDQRGMDIPEPAREQVARPEFVWARHAAVQVGTIVHAMLNDIAKDGLERWTKTLIEQRRLRFKRQLVLLGVDPADIDRSAQRIIDALTGVLDDGKGRWILGVHSDAASELPITVRTPRGLEHRRIDRVFLDDAGVRWIVDYKTSEHVGGAVGDFLDSEEQRYRLQLEEYADAMAAMESRPTRVGLYFPLLQSFRSWEPGTV